MDDLRQAWERDGYVVLRGAAPTEQIAEYARELDADRDGLLVRSPGDEHVSLGTTVQPSDDRPSGAVDPYALSAAARALLLPADLVRFLTRDVFGNDAPLLFDAVEASAGSPDDGPFRDATYVALASEPETLVTATVALEAGVELTTFPGSQHIPSTPFGGRYRHHNPERDGDTALQRHRDELTAATRPRAHARHHHLEPRRRRRSGAPTSSTPRSPGSALIAHLCPVRVQPSWFTYRPERARHAAHTDGIAWIATQHYDLVDAVAPGEPPVGVHDEPELERVEQGLRDHDESNAPQPQPVSGRRGGGLVDSVRGLMSRRGRG